MTVAATNLPGIVDVHVYVDAFDEWYGPAATFKWERPLEGLPDPDPFDWERRAPYREHAIDCVLQHPAWAAFFTKPHVIEVATTGSNYTPRTVTVKKVTSRDADWEVRVDQTGGNVWAKTDW